MASLHRRSGGEGYGRKRHPAPEVDDATTDPAKITPELVPASKLAPSDRKINKLLQAVQGSTPSKACLDRPFPREDGSRYVIGMTRACGAPPPWGAAVIRGIVQRDRDPKWTLCVNEDLVRLGEVLPRGVVLA